MNINGAGGWKFKAPPSSPGRNSLGAKSIGGSPFHEQIEFVSPGNLGYPGSDGWNS